MKLILGICLFFFGINSYAAISKWVDAEGKVHYSDIAPSNVGAKTIKSSSTEYATPASGVAAPKTQAEREADWKKSQKLKEETAQKEAKEQEAASTKKKNCESARSNLMTLENSPALVTYNEKGERIFVDDATRKQRTEETRQAVNTYCN